VSYVGVCSCQTSTSPSSSDLRRRSLCFCFPVLPLFPLVVPFLNRPMLKSGRGFFSATPDDESGLVVVILSFQIVSSRSLFESYPLQAPPLFPICPSPFAAISSSYPPMFTCLRDCSFPVSHLPPTGGLHVTFSWIPIPLFGLRSEHP